MRISNYDTFWQHIHKSAKEKSFPLRVMFELTYRCNFRCRHCYVPLSYRNKEELKTKEIFSILEQLKDIGCFYLGFTGGEPFMRKDFIEILWYAKKIGFELIIYTNGSLINGRVAGELQRIRPNKIDITIPAMSRHAFERITGAAGSYRKVFNTIDLLHNRGIILGFKTCVLKENKSEIKEIQDFAHSLGALHRLDDMLSPRLDGSKEPYRYRGILKQNSVADNTSQVSRKTSQVIEKRITNCDLEDCNKKTMDYGLSTMDLFKCGVGISQAVITPLGELKMCLMIDYPKYKILDTEIIRSSGNQVIRQKANLKEAWKSLKKLVASIKPDENYHCDKCRLYTYCKWCPGKGWLYNRSFTTCEPESKQWAEARSNGK